MSAEQAKQFVDQASQSLQGSQFAQALELLDQAIGLDPDSSEPHVLRGIALSQLNRAQEATEAFRRAIMLSPYNVKAYYNLAVHYYTQGEKAAAEEMAREAVRIEPKHAGAKDLLTRIQSESHPTESRQEPLVLPGDPLLPREQATAETPGGAAPPLAPSATPSTPQPASYYRPGYQPEQPVHSMPFVAKMGKTWDTIGWSLGAISTLVAVIAFIRQFVQIQEMFSDFEGFMSRSQGAGFWEMTSVGDILLSLVGLLVLLLSYIWFIMELADRRGNWLWLLPFILCCCCYQFNGPVMLIYLWKGRD